MKHTFVAALAVLVLASSPAHAETKQKPLAQSLTGTAKADYDLAKTLLDDGDAAAAETKFKTAYDSSHDPRLLWNIAVCEKQQRHYARVLEALRRYLELGEGVISATDKREAEDLIKTIEPLVTRLLVIAKEPDALVSLDGAELGKTPLPGSVLIDINQKKLRITKAGFRPFEQVLNTSAADTRVEVTMVPDVHVGTFDLAVTPKGAIYIDGNLVGNNALRTPLSSGIHALRITSAGMTSYQADIAIEDDKVRTLRLTLEKEPSRGVSAWVWVLGGGVLLAGAGVGGYFLFKPKTEDVVLPPAGTLSPGVVVPSAR
jgi:PEGA domain